MINILYIILAVSLSKIFHSELLGLYLQPTTKVKNEVETMKLI